MLNFIYHEFTDHENKKIYTEGVVILNLKPKQLSRFYISVVHNIKILNM